MNRWFERFKRPALAKVLVFIVASVAIWGFIIFMIQGKRIDPVAPTFKTVVIAPENQEGTTVKTPQVVESQSNPEVVDDVALYEAYVRDQLSFEGQDWVHVVMTDLSGDGKPEMLVFYGASRLQIFGGTLGKSDYSLIERNNGSLSLFGIENNGVIRLDGTPRILSIGGLGESPIFTNQHVKGSNAHFKRDTFMGKWDGIEMLFVMTLYATDTYSESLVEGFRMGSNQKFERVFQMRGIQGDDLEWTIQNVLVDEAQFKSAVQMILDSKSSFVVSETIDPDFEEGLYEIAAYQTSYRSASAPQRPLVTIEEPVVPSQLDDIEAFLATGQVFPGVILGQFTVEAMTARFGPYKEKSDDADPYYAYDFGVFQSGVDSLSDVVFAVHLYDFAGMRTNGTTTKASVQELLGDRFEENMRVGTGIYSPNTYTELIGSKATLLIGFNEAGVVSHLILTTP